MRNGSGSKIPMEQVRKKKEKKMGKHKMIKEKTKTIIRLHIKENKSTRVIAELLGMSKNSVLGVLRYQKKLKQAPGIKEEKKVLKWFKKNGHEVIRQKGNAPFDAFIDGERVDVKSSSLGFSSKRRKPKRYFFEVQHKLSVSHVKPDWYCLLMKNTGDLYKLPAVQVNVKAISIQSHLKRILK